MTPDPEPFGEIPQLERGFFASGRTFARLGEGECGGKAHGLLRLDRALRRRLDADRFHMFEVRVPASVIVTTEVFDAFVDRNNLRGLAHSDLSDVHIARAFQEASMPTEVLGDLQVLVDEVKVPLAIRSSALLEDTLDRPFAGIYETKMTPNDQHDVAERFRRLVEAIKFVYASTYFRAPRAYAQVTGHDISTEKMAVLLQEVVGSRRWERFYPTVSGVGRSFDYYAADAAHADDGVMSLALGLGKTIVDGGASWTYTPKFPRKPPPYGSNRDLLRMSQNRFWAVRMGRPKTFDPTAEDEFLVEGDLSDAELDGALAKIVSTYDAASDRLVMGLHETGARVVTFAPLLRLQDEPFNDLVDHVLTLSRDDLGSHVEIEVAADWGPARERPLFSLLQARPMFVPAETLELADLDAIAGERLLASPAAVGHGIEKGIRDIIYVRRDTFRAEETPRIAQEVASLNTQACEEGRPYLLIGFGRWGTTDPWGGIPVAWEQISGAKIIVEGSLPGFRADPSQGSHFFHNVTALRVLYFGLDEEETGQVDWRWLESQAPAGQTEHVVHLRLAVPLYAAVDGRSRHGVVWTRPPSQGDDEPGATETRDGDDA